MKMLKEGKARAGQSKGGEEDHRQLLYKHALVVAQNS